MRARLTRRLHDESGVALPIVAMVLALILTLGSVAFSQAIDATNTASRDLLARKASQAAQAGIDEAAYRMNALSLDLSSLLDITTGGNPLKNQCVITTGGVLGISALSDLGSWCPVSTPEPLGNGSYFQYQISPVVGLNSAQADRAGKKCNQLLSGLPAILNCTLGLLGAVLNQNLYDVDGIVGLDFTREIVAIGKAGPDCSLTAAGTDGPRCIKRRFYARYVSDDNAASVAHQNTGLLSLLNATLQSALIGPLTNGGELDAQLKLYHREANSFRECTATLPTGSSTPAGGC
ncbi:MAG: hypothetical protein QOG62_688 [Thermoleophilaceae bacterium]|nr:hypothetical protein [Thermoleophilaceae bacterium]